MDSLDMPHTYPRMQSNQVRFKDDPRSDPIHYSRRQFPRKYTFRNKHNVATLTSPRSNSYNSQKSRTISSTEIISSSQDDSYALQRSHAYSEPDYKNFQYGLDIGNRMKSWSMHNLSANDGNFSMEYQEMELPQSVEREQNLVRKYVPKNLGRRFYTTDEEELGDQNQANYRDDRSEINRPSMEISCKPLDTTRSMGDIATSSRSQDWNTVTSRPRSAQGRVDSAYHDFSCDIHFDKGYYIGDGRNISLSNESITNKKGISQDLIQAEREKFAESVRKKIDEINQRAGIRSQSMYDLHREDVRRLAVPKLRSRNELTPQNQLPYLGELGDKSRSMVNLYGVNEFPIGKYSGATFTRSPHNGFGSRQRLASQGNLHKDAVHSVKTHKLSSSKSDISEKPKVVMKNSSSQTYLLDRKLEGRSVDDLAELSSSVNCKKLDTEKYWDIEDPESRVSDVSTSSKTSEFSTLKDPSVKILFQSAAELLSVKRGNDCDLNKDGALSALNSQQTTGEKTVAVEVQQRNFVENGNNRKGHNGNLKQQILCLTRK